MDMSKVDFNNLPEGAALVIPVASLTSIGSVSGSAEKVTRRRGRSVRRGRAKVRTSSNGHRGRKPGRYLVAGKKGPDERKTTESMQKIFDVLKSHKDGLGFREISALLKMPTGTVGWALTKLKDQSIIRLEPSREAAAAA